jgi:DNA-binding LacI/PurR family transcriptional regulator
LKFSVSTVSRTLNNHPRIAFINGPDKLAASKERLNCYIYNVYQTEIKGRHAIGRDYRF